MNLQELKQLGLALDKSAMKQITGGYGSGGPCRLYTLGQGWGSCISYTSAYNNYHNRPWRPYGGYCCASCGTGNFSNATPC